MRLLALDIGSTSCGFAVMTEKDKNQYTLHDYGVVMRDNPYDGGTQKERSGHKQMRQLLQKRKNRVSLVGRLFTEHGFNVKERGHIDLWKLRAVEAFERKLAADELYAILRFLAKHRGYKSLKIEDLIAEIEAQEKIGDCESGEIAVPNALQFSETLAYLDALKCHYKEKTTAQIIYDIEQEKKVATFRNHDNYRYMIRREDVAKEIGMLINAQESFGFFGTKKQAESFTETIKAIIIPQDPVMLNPDLINNCLIYKDEKSAPVYSYSFDLFRFYQMINDLKIDGKSATQEQKEKLINAYTAKIKALKSIASIRVIDVKKLLGITDELVRINNTSEYRTLKGKKEANVLRKFNFISKLSKFDLEIMQSIMQSQVGLFDAMATIIHRNIDPNTLLEGFYDLFRQADLEFEKERIKTFALQLHKQKNGGTSAYSFKALNALMALMQEGMNESSAKEIVGIGKAENYSAYQKGIKYLKPIERDGTFQYENDENRISNHVVKSLVAWVNRVVADLHDKHGPFDVIKLESTRELSQPDEVKKQIKSANDKNQKEWEALADRYTEHLKAKKVPERDRNRSLLKLKLWEQQEKMGIYSLRPISIDDVLSEKTEIEHIVPRACGGSNAEYNKAIDYKDVNIRKGNRLPLGFLEGDAKEAFKVFADELKENYKINWKKWKNLKAETLDQTFKEASDEVSLHATSYTEKLLGEMLKRYYPFTEKLKENQRVLHVSGRATSYLRRILSIDNKSRDTNFHHAEDAILIGLMSRAYLQNISTNFEKNYEQTEQNAKENFKKIMPLIDGAVPNEVFAHLRKSYMKNIEENPFYIGLDGSLRAPAFWVSKKSIGTKAHNETIQSKKNMAYRVSVDTLLDKVRPTHKMSAEAFTKAYNKEVYGKVQVAKDNPNDFTARAFAEKRDKIAGMLNEAAFLTSKEEKAEMDKRLRDAMRRPIVDVNGNVVRRVKRVGEEATIEIRNGLAYTAPSLVCLRCSYTGEDKLMLRRIDIRDYAKNGSTLSNQMDVFNNDLIELFVEKKQEVVPHSIGLLKGFTESGMRAYLRNPKYPLLKEKQPKKFQNIFSFGSGIGLKKFKIDSSGHVQGFYYLGKIIENGEVLFAKVLKYKKV